MFNILTLDANAQASWAPGEEQIYQRAQALLKAGRPAEAVTLGEQRLALVERTYGANSREMGPALDALGSYCLEAGDREKARMLFNQSISLARKLSGPEDVWSFVALRGLGKVEVLSGNYTAALPLLERALHGGEELMGKNDLLVATLAEDLAKVQAQKLNFAKAVPLFERVLQIREAALGKEHPGVANAQLNLGMVLHRSGKNSEAEAVLTRALAMHEKTSGPAHPHTAVALKELGLFYNDLGAYDRAQPLLERALQISEQTQGEDHLDTIIALHSLATVKGKMLQPAEAEILQRRALKAATKVLGPEHPMTQKISGDLGSTLSNLGRNEEAITHLRSYLAFVERRSVASNPELFEPLNNLAMALRKSGQNAEAEPLLRRALAVATKAFGPQSEAVATAESNLSYCLHDLGQTAEARTLATHYLEHRCRLWEDYLRFGSEAELEQAFHTVNGSGIGERLGDAGLAATAALRFKDGLINALLENQRRVRASPKSSESRKLASAADEARQRMRELVLRQAPERELAKARNEVETTDKALARKVGQLGQTRGALKVTPQEIAAALPKGAALIEFTHYAVPNPKEAGKLELTYGAVVLPAGSAAQLVTLGNATALETQIDAFLKLLQEPPAALPDAAVDAALEKGAKELHAALIAPVLAVLPPATTTLVISPESYLHLVPFAVLMDAEGRFLAETQELRYVSSGRDLLTAPRTVAKNKTALLLGDPDYAMPLQDLHPLEGTRLSEVAGSLQFEALPGTAAEVAALKTQLTAAKWKVNLLSGTAATDTAIQETPSPTVLHLATHGFFMDGRKNAATLPGAGSSIFASSMANSGLAFAGATFTTRQWAAGRAPAAAADGILTAAEATALNLEGTDLVALSACETGLGVVMTGSGVAGLKRALMLTGARHLLTTLWKVNDEETARFMQDFYARFLAGEDPGAALTHTQAEALKRLRAKTSLWFAMTGAGPFVLTATTRWTK